MSRPLRNDPPGGHHHIMNRGARHEPIFWTNEDCAELLGLLDQWAPRFQVEVHAYALMPNHLHLLVVSNGGRLSDFMAKVLGNYARYRNREPRRDGPVWRGRFKSQLVTDDVYWMHLVAYIHLNPVRAGLVGDPRFSHWTSLDTYMHHSRSLECLRTDEVLDAYGGLDTMLEYMADVQRKRTEGPEGFDPDELWRIPRTQPVAPTSRAPVTVRPHRSPEQAIAEVCQVTGTTAEALFQYRRGAANRPAWVAAWWLQLGAGLTQREVARIMGIGQTGVAQRGRLLRKYGEEADLQQWVAALTGLPAA